VTPPDAGAPAVGRLQRLRLLALAAIVALLGVALANAARDDAAPATPAGASGPDAAELAALRDAAALEPCPAGLGQALPELVLPCLSGGPDVELTAAPSGRPTLVNVWGSWCGPCVEEVPLLNAVDARGGDRLDVVGVLTQDSLRSALAFADAYDMHWPSVVDDDGTVMRAFSPGPPVTLFVRPDGSLAHVERGAFASEEEIAAAVAEHLGVIL
jgi:cytochrome c biogenesis protein CcmG/thiol:disulfide interchange protein DsbE